MDKKSHVATPTIILQCQVAESTQIVGRVLGHPHLSQNETNGIVQPGKRQTMLGKESMKIESKTSVSVPRSSVLLRRLGLFHIDVTQTAATIPTAIESNPKLTTATIAHVGVGPRLGNYLQRSKATDTTAAKASVPFHVCKYYQSQSETSTTHTTPATPQAHTALTALTIHASLTLAAPEQSRTCTLPLRKGKSMRYPSQVPSMAIQQALTALKSIRVPDTPQGGTNLALEQHRRTSQAQLST